MGQTVTVTVDHLDALIAESKCRNQEIVLYLDGRPLKDVTAYPPNDPTFGVLRFPLKRTEASREEWTHLLGSPGLAARKVPISVGLKNKYAVTSKASIDLQVVPIRWFLIWLVLFVFIAGVFIALARKSDILRDPGPFLPAGARRPYSLARTQAACWFFVVLASYLFIGLITGDFASTITGTVLALLGIAAATTVGATVVDASTDTPQTRLAQDNIRAQLVAKMPPLALSVADATAARDALVATNANDTATNAIAKAAADAELASASAALADARSRLRTLRGESRNMLVDITSDLDGVSFHRFQMAAWTLVLGIVFVIQVYQVLAMPEFNQTLLGLLGISAGTYVGLKIPENSSTSR